MSRTAISRGCLVASVGLLACIALVACGGSSGDKAATGTANTQTTSQSDPGTTTTTVSSQTPTTPAPVQGAPTTFPSGSSVTGSSADITFKNICSFATAAEMSAATGVSGLEAKKPALPTADHPEALCIYDNPSAPTISGVAALSYDPSFPVSYGRQADDHGLNGFKLEAPTPDEAAYGAAHPGTGRGIVKVSWVYKTFPVSLRMNETTADGVKTIAEAQKINARFPAE